MEFIREENEDMSDPQSCKIKNEDTEEQRGLCPFLILHFMWNKKVIKLYASVFQSALELLFIFWFYTSW